MKIVIAADSYKGCMSAPIVVQTIEKGIRRANPNHRTFCFPMADGGEGTARVYQDLMQAECVKAACVDAYGKEMTGRYVIDADRAVMDVATCIGLNMTPRDKRNPMIASSMGVGMMMKAAMERGCREIVVGLGGSATNDGGMGLLHAFGVRFYDKKNRVLTPNAYALNRIARIDASAFTIDPSVRWIAMCDVKNPLLGPKGATYTFGRQKGIFPNQMKEVDGWMRHYARQMEKAFRIDISQTPGSGAAGGIGAVLIGIFRARMENGIDYMIKLSQIEKDIRDCDLVITGEGQTDQQTLYGKVPYGILQIAKQYDKPVLCLSGALSRGYEALYEAGMAGIFSSADKAMTFQQALSLGEEKLEALAYSIMKYTDVWTGGNG